MGDVIQFRPKKRKEQNEHMCPDDWATPYNPTHRELRLTLKTVKNYRTTLLDELATAGVQSEFNIRDRLKKCDCMLNSLMAYYFTFKD